MSALVLACKGLLSLNQLRVGGGSPVASQFRDIKLFTTTVTFSSLMPTIEGDTDNKHDITNN